MKDQDESNYSRRQTKRGDVSAWQLSQDLEQLINRIRAMYFYAQHLTEDSDPNLETDTG
jgi:hypothetical protein